VASLTCKATIDLLAEYLEETLALDVAQRLERHLEGCEACLAYWVTYRRTRKLTAEVNRVQMPDEMRARLRDFLLERLRAADD
jgi:anti-sigma factor RsiW